MRTVLGILSFLAFLIVPILLTYLFFGFIPQMMELEQQGAPADPKQLIPMLGVFFGLLMLLGLVSFGLMVYYIIHISMDETATGNDRVLWILLLVFFSNFVLPFYWYFRIWKNNDIGS